MKRSHGMRQATRQSWLSGGRTRSREAGWYGALISLAFALGGYACVLAALAALRGPEAAPPAAAPPLPRLPVPPPPKSWLGLNYNSGSDVGSLRDFALRGLLYDRLGDLEVTAGDTPTSDRGLASGLRASYGAGMVPVIQVDPAVGPRGCDSDPTPSKLCLPVTPVQDAAYARGFAVTARSVLSFDRHHRALLEPTDEPWDWGSPPGSRSGRGAASQFAQILARMLPAASAAGVPLARIYVPATGTLDDGTTWVPDLYDAQPCLKPGPGTCGPVAGWSLHPYGLPGSDSEGIDSVPVIRETMLSGTNNIIVSEIGFCAIDVNGGGRCDENRSDIVGTSKQASTWLAATLRAGARMHEAGWLKALLVWERSGGGGWAMQNRNGTLTAQGRTLDLFAESAQGR